MEITSRLKERETPSPSPLNSPRPTTTTTTTTTVNGGNIPITTRSDPNSPYPTTFVTADTTSFKHVVQMLTGSSDSPSPRHHHHHHHPSPPSSGSRHSKPAFEIPLVKTHQGQGGFKLYERRNSAAFKNMIINAHRQNAAFPARPEILSPSLLDFPGLTLSPVTPLTDDPFGKSSPSVCNGSVPSDEEEKAIKDRGFYFHPSPISTPRDSEPQLLPLFPLSSPRVSDS